MAVYIMTGKLGSGKTLAAVGRIRDYLRQGRRVATNLNLKVEQLLGPMNRTASVVRVSDKPTAEELEALGLGAPELDEGRYGLLVLDELGSWLNARTWGDKERQGVIDWLIHSRKRRWDVVFIVQHVSMIDKQVREALLEYLVTCKRLDRIRVPFLGQLGRLLTLGVWDGRMPKVHLAIVVYAGGSATLQGAMVSDRWIYRGHDLYGAYQTEQVFAQVPDASIRGRGGVEPVMAGSWSLLTPWHLVGRYLTGHGWRHLVAVFLRSVQAATGFGPQLVVSRPPGAALARFASIRDKDARWRVARDLVQRGAL